MVALFKSLIRKCVDAGELRIAEEAVDMAAHHLVVQGQMWAFRRWAIRSSYTIDDFIRLQTDQLLNGLVKSS